MLENPPETLVDDLGWCWWTRPRAVQVGELLYVGGIDSAGKVVIASWSPANGVVERTPLATLEPDDHNNPAIVVDELRPSLAFYSRHDEDDALRWRRSMGPLDITNWGPERAISFGGIVTYAQVHSRGDELHLLTRVDDIGWGYCRSANWGETWSDPLPFVELDTDQETYLASTLLDDGQTVRVAIAGHPKEYRAKPRHDVWTCLLDLVSGDVTRPDGGPAIANVRTGDGLPLGEQELELVFACPPDRTTNLFDISDAPQTEIAFVSKLKSDQRTEDARYHVSRRTDDGWVTEDVVPAGTVFGYIPAGFYAGGMAFPARSSGDSVHLAREDAGQWFLETWSRTTDGWRGEPLLPQSSERFVRPWAVSDATTAPPVVALALEVYDDDYMKTRSRLVGARGTAVVH